MNSRYHLMEYNKRKYRDQVSWVMQKRLTCSSAQYSASPEKNSLFYFHTSPVANCEKNLSSGMRSDNFYLSFSFSEYY